MKTLLAAAAIAATGTAALATSECDTYDINDDGWAHVYQLPGSKHTFWVMMDMNYVGQGIIDEVNEDNGNLAWVAGAIAVSHICDHVGGVALSPAYGLDPIADIGNNLAGGYITIVHPSDIIGVDE